MSTEVSVPTSAGGLEDHDWEALLDAIDHQDCTPFLGAGACAGRLPTAMQLAFDLATRTGYPLPDCDDLARVSQFVAIRSGPMYAKRKVLKILGFEPNECNCPHSNLATEEDPHSVLAQLPLKLYITTNYDDFMFKALKQYGRDVRSEHCCWYTSANGSRVEERARWEPLSVQKPLVFHLHGCHNEPASMVLTEDDYVDFLVSIGRELKIVPPVIQGAIAGSSLLFIGYGLRDWNFRVLHRALLSQVEQSQKWPSFTVQLTPLDFQTGCVATVHMKNGDKITGTVIAGERDRYTIESHAVGTLQIDSNDVRHIQVVQPCDNQLLTAIEDVKSYLKDYYGQMKIRVFWGTANQFVCELWRRWNSRKAQGGGDFTSGDSPRRSSPR